MHEDFKKEPKVKSWIETVEAAGCTVKAIEPIKIISKSSGELLFALIKSQVKEPSGRGLLPYALIRGHACVIAPRAIKRGTGERKFVMVRQRRIGNGHDSLEFPAGMLDSRRDALEVAVEELREETGLSIDKGALYALHPGPLYSSPGLCDEGIYYYGCELELDPPEYENLHGRRTGTPGEGEHIRVELHSEQEALKLVSSLQTRLGFYLFREYENVVEEE